MGKGVSERGGEVEENIEIKSSIGRWVIAKIKLLEFPSMPHPLPPRPP